MIYELPQKLKLLRARYNYSQKQVANKLGISPSIISGYETGERTPSAEILLSLSYLYNCSVDYLLGKENDLSNIKIDVTGLTDKQIRAINTLIQSIIDGQ